MNFSMDFAALGLYVASFVAYTANLYRDRRWIGRVATLLLIFALVAHYYALLERSRIIHAIPYDDLYGSMSLFAWLGGVTYLGLETHHRQRAVGSLVVPFIIFWMIVAISVAPSSVLRAPPAPMDRFSPSTSRSAFSRTPRLPFHFCSASFIWYRIAYCGTVSRALPSGGFRRLMCLSA